MHTIVPARLKPGVDLANLAAAAVAVRAVASRFDSRRDSRQGADLLGPESPRQEEEARRHRHRSDHARRRLRVREPRHARRALEGRRVPLPDARFSRARASRRDVRHRRRSVRDRIVARDEPRRAEGDRRTKSASRWSIVCGNNMGDIFRRNALNLGLQVVQSPEAVADARDGDEFAFEPETRRLTNETQGENVRTRAADAEGGRDSPDRRHLRDRPPRVRGVGESRRRGSSGRTPRSARGMTTTEQIVWAHRVDRGRRRHARGDAARLRRSAAGVGRHRAVRHPHLQPDHRRQHDLPAPGGDRQRSLRLHRQGRRRQADGDRARVRDAARDRAAVLRDARRRHLPLLFSRAGARHARAVHSGRRLAQPRLRRVRRGRHGRRIDDARLRMGDRLHLLHGREGAARRLRRQAAALGRAARTSSSSCCGAGARSSRRACRSSSWIATAAADRLSQHDREHDGGGRGAERHLRARRDHDGVVPREGRHRAAVPGVRARRRRRLRDRRDAESLRRGADDREAVQSRATRFRRTRSRASASRSTRR